MGVEERLAELGIDLPDASPPFASYVPVLVDGGFAYVSGQIAHEGGTPVATGRLGEEVDTERGAELARRCAVQILAALKAELGGLDRVRQIVKLTVFVASAEGFTDQPKVANGASDFLVEVFGDAGRHARAAVGVSVLPLDAPVEVELIAAV